MIVTDMAVYSLLLVLSREVKRLAPGRGAMNQVSAVWAGKKRSAAGTVSACDSS